MGQCPFFRQAAEVEQEAAVRREEQFDKPAARAHSKVMKQPYNTSSQDDLVLMWQVGEASYSCWRCILQRALMVTGERQLLSASNL